MVCEFWNTPNVSEESRQEKKNGGNNTVSNMTKYVTDNSEEEIILKYQSSIKLQACDQEVLVSRPSTDVPIY